MIVAFLKLNQVLHNINNNRHSVQAHGFRLIEIQSHELKNNKAQLEFYS